MSLERCVKTLAVLLLSSCLISCVDLRDLQTSDADCCRVDPEARFGPVAALCLLPQFPEAAALANVTPEQAFSNNAAVCVCESEGVGGSGAC